MTLNRGRIAGVLSLLIVMSSAAAVCRGADEESAEVVLLKQHGITADAAGVTAYLTNLFPSDALRQEIDRLILQLGSDDFRDRETASRKLTTIWAAYDALQQATRNTDAEVSHRSRRILEETEQWRESVLLGVLRFIQKEKLPGLVPQLLRAMPLCDKEHLRRAASDALSATVVPDDAPALKAAIASDQREVRIASITALQRTLREKSVVTLRPLLKAEDPAIRLAAAEALIDHVPRESLEVLPGLLETDQPALRLRSDRILRLLTGQKFGSIGDAATVESRAEIAMKWRRWVDGPGRDAALQVPLPTGKAKMGRVLVCVNQPGGPNGMTPKLVEFNELWQMSVLRDGNANIALPFGCQGLPDGHRLYSDWRSQSIIELDENGKETWQQRVPTGPASVERLENGNTLVAVYQNQQVAEINRTGQTVWQINVGGAASDAHLLENGNVLVVLSDQGWVAEFDRTGRTLWKATGLPNPWSARRLSNGNTIVACNGEGKVLELSPDKRIVRSIDNLPNCFDVDMLENGNLLIGYAQGLREVNPKGEKVREHPIGMVRRLSIY
ncbi:MAG: PQQ-binding-like beta-propeller repeat protein [Planctomycetes bacterium]|nr:PQQ-binding-like beta-propeller repeat protein [Planctomycetota bacterium]